MSEVQKTLCFVGAALLVGITGIALQARRTSTTTDIQRVVGTPFFEDLEGTENVASLEVIEVNEDLASRKTFKIAKERDSDVWVIPSESNYPADAKEQVRDAATMFVGLERADVASQLSDDHGDFGVLEPSEDNVAKKGIGKLIILQDRQNEDLARLIIGKAVKGRDGSYFVRQPGQDVVWVAEIEKEKLSTDFSDWIKKDLLDVNAFDIENIQLNDYSVVDVQVQNRLSPQKLLTPRMEAALKFDSANSEWSLEEMLIYNAKREKEPSPLGPDEELNSQQLNDLKYALDELEIVGVYPKPEGLGADLVAGAEFMENEDNQRSLAEKGFYPQPLDNGKYALKAANGEVHVTTKKGVQYVLRFGGINVQTGVEEGKANRYLFVSTRVDESKFPMPVKEQLPGPPAGPPEPAESTESTEEPKESAEPTESTEEPKESTEPADDAAVPEPGDECFVPQDTEDTPASDDPAEPSSDTPATNEPPAPDVAPEALVEFRKLQEQGLPERMDDTLREAEMQRIEKEFQRQVDEREENIKQARARVAELNARFAGWYYVVSEETYKQIHLGRADIVKKKGEESAAGAMPPGAMPPGGPALNFPANPAP